MAARSQPTLDSLGEKLQSLQISNNTITTELERALGELALEVSKVRQANEFLVDVVKEQMIKGFKEESKLFEKLFREIIWTGSFYEGLKISKPDEFDLNIVLDMSHFKDIQVVARTDLPGYVTVKNFGPSLRKLQLDPIWASYVRELNSWNDDNSGNLLQTKVHSWFEGLVVNFANKYNATAKPQLRIIKVVKSGPALTLCFQKWSIDVVPAFSFTDAPPHPIRTPSKAIQRPWVIVPKPHDNGEGVQDAWRLSFYQCEKLIIHDYGTVKPAIKLVKRIRDIEKWESNVFSYTIKTVALWLIELKKLSKEDNINISFMKVLKTWKIYLEKGDLPFYWDQRDNLLKKLTPQQRENYVGRLNFIIRKFEDNAEENPEVIGKT